MKAYFGDGGFQAYAHRGGAALWPQNTLTAFQGAVDLGFRFIETDVQMTRDGKLVLFHDPVLDDLTDGRGAVAEWTWEDLRRLDAGYAFGREQGFPHRGAGVRIPTVEEVFAAFPDVSFTLELKVNGAAATLIELIRRFGREDTVIIGSFLQDALSEFRVGSGGRIATSATKREAQAMWAASRIGARIPVAADAFQVPPVHRVRVVDRCFVSACRRAGKPVHVWTVNEPDAMRSLLDLGVGGIMSDRPDLLRDVLAERGKDV
jgi:glycerophosphoryl diester phosphodiesterase